MYRCYSIIPCGLYAYNQLSTAMKPEIIFVVKIPVSQFASYGDHRVVLNIPIEAQLTLSYVIQLHIYCYVVTPHMSNSGPAFISFQQVIFM